MAQLASLGTLKAARDNVLLHIGFFGGLRRSELVSIEVEYVAWEVEGIAITLPRSETDQLGEGIVKAIPNGARPCCPATALRACFDAAGIAGGPVFRPISKWGELAATALHGGSVNAILEACVRRWPNWTTSRICQAPAARQGGWRHDGTAQGYIEEPGRFEENAAGSLLRAR